jgi:hypothetical protein
VCFYFEYEWLARLQRCSGRPLAAVGRPKERADVVKREYSVSTVQARFTCGRRYTAPCSVKRRFSRQEMPKRPTDAHTKPACSCGQLAVSRSTFRQSLASLTLLHAGRPVESRFYCCLQWLSARPCGTQLFLHSQMNFVAMPLIFRLTWA